MEISRKWFIAIALALSLLRSKTALSHELPANRATLVLRDQTHLSLTLYIDYIETLHRALAPNKSARDFLLITSALTPQEFQQQLQRAQAKLDAETRATLNGASTVTIAGWVWPEPAKIQSLIQQQVMAAMVGAGEHSHAAPIEIRANITHTKPISEATIQFAEAFGKMLVVWYRPKQTWVAPKQLSPVMKF